VTLSDEERGALPAVIHTGKHPAQKLLKARILLKAAAWDDDFLATLVVQ